LAEAGSNEVFNLGLNLVDPTRRKHGRY